MVARCAGYKAFYRGVREEQPLSRILALRVDERRRVSVEGHNI